MLQEAARKGIVERKLVRVTDGGLKEPDLRTKRGVGRVSVYITLDGRTYPIGFAASGEEFGREADFLVPLLLFPAVISGYRGRLGAAGQQRHLQNLRHPRPVALDEWAVGQGR
jgi:hypothetical protein